MIDEQPDMQEQSPDSTQGKLVLSSEAHELSEPQWNGADHEMHTMHIPQEHIQPHRSMPALSFVPSRWRRGTAKGSDPAYKIVTAAIILLLLMGIGITIFATNASAQLLTIFNPNGQGASIPANAPKGVHPAGTVDLQPVFPTPGGGQGSTTSSQPPTTGTQVLPVDTPMPTVQPTSTQGQGGQLTIQITNAPSLVRNGLTTYISINASEPGATVRLIVTYDAPPGFYASGQQTTDDAGNATLQWRVRVFSNGNGHVTARVIAVAQDQNGQQAQSPMLIVPVNGGFGG